MMQRLKRCFYERPTLEVARDMLGKYLVFEGKVAKIIETEAYLGPEDLASHARFKSRKRNYLMFGQPGIAYVYFTYGMYNILNIITEQEGVAGGVMLRALRPIHGITTPTDGPGKLTSALGITRLQNGLDMTQSALYLEDRHESPTTILTAPRIGIDYAGPYKDKPWRFIMSSSAASES